MIRDDHGTVGKIFLLRMDLSDMPSDSQTIIRQKHFYHNNLVPLPTIQHGMQIAIKRVTECCPPKPILDCNGVVCLGGRRSVDRTLIYGTIRLVFSFNQAATIGHASKDTSMMREHLQIVTDYLPDGKYTPLKRTLDANAHNINM